MKKKIVKFDMKKIYFVLIILGKWVGWCVGGCVGGFVGEWVGL